ncbi:MAG: DUF922 domain-containing protein, partial [candidate division NC10 bacterium]
APESPPPRPSPEPRSGHPAAVAARSGCFVQADAFQGVYVSTRFKYYDVRGSTPEELTRQIDQLGPFNKWLGRNSIGKADCRILSPYKFIRNLLGECRLSSFGVNVDVAITLPRWDQQGPPDLRARWSRAMRSVQSHEESHRAIAFRAANEVYRALHDLPPGPCGEFESSLKAMLEKRYDQAERDQVEFDKAVYRNPDCRPGL